MRLYVEFSDQAEAEKVLAQENQKQGFPMEGCVTQRAFNIASAKDGKFLIPKEFVTVELDKAKTEEKIIDVKQRIQLPSMVKSENELADKTIKK